ncbi:MAG: ComEC/Rec2 family competence protein [Bacteroidales bacterium]|nr:ComEC/Rec2 family competence protein [Bacteroidales bacterium]
MRGRISDIEVYAAAFVAGDVAAGCCAAFWAGPEASATKTIIISILAILIPAVALVATLKKWRTAMTAAMLMLGVMNAAIGRYPAPETEMRAKSAAAREHISQMLYDAAGGGSEGAILSAIAIGDRSRIDRALKSDFKKSGAMHLMALSGLHIGVLYLLITLTLCILGNSPPARITRKTVTLTLLWSYAIITGLSTSILRAVMMITIYEAGELAGSRRNLIRALAISALISTLANPDAPFQIGFQLSYGAMAGIGVIYPRLKTILECRSALMEKVWNTVALSLSCQAATAPLVWLYFGTFPRYFLITNFVAIPLTSAAIYLTPLTLLTKNLPVAGDFLTSALRLSLSLLKTVIGIIAGL